MMAMTKVYFATNRVADDPTNSSSYGADILSPGDSGSIIYAVADVEGVNLDKGDFGTLNAISSIHQGNFLPEVQEEIVSAGKNLLVFIHGFANSFTDAITRVVSVN